MYAKNSLNSFNELNGACHVTEKQHSAKTFFWWKNSLTVT